MVSLEDIQKLAGRIAREFRPESIILFGSYARGNPRADSDVDLLVVLPHTDKCWETAASVRGRVRPRFPVDLVVRSPEELHKRLEIGDVFFRDILEHGTTLYEARHV
jgi:predicted nucleotidyltransferase